MSIVKTKDLTFEYIRRDEEDNVSGITTAIDNVNLRVEQGQFIAILGHNGSGKSTLAKHINALLYPTQGAVYVDGMDTTEEENTLKIRQTAGMVFQNPDNQIIGTVVDEEVAFGPENLGVETKEIWKRVEESLRNVSMYTYKDYSPNKLSGGQKQRVAIAGVLAMKPKCIVLDEPTAMLDPLGRKEVIDTLIRLNREEKVTIILITHYMKEVVEADKVFVMDSGKVVMEGTPKEIFARVEELTALRLDVPQVTKLAYELEKSGIPMPKGILSIDEFVANVMKNAPKSVTGASQNSSYATKNQANDKSVPHIIVNKLNHIYAEGTGYERFALRNINVTIKKGEFIGLIGHTGSGKSTLTQHLNGLLKATGGEIYYNGENIYDEGYNMVNLRSKVGLVFQYPEYQLFEETVFKDVCFGPKNLGLPKKEIELRAYEALKNVGFADELFYQSPFDLSGGQKRRVAIAGVLAMKPEVLILDEPTAGLDPKGRDEILDKIAEMHKELGITVILVSHSMEDVAKYVDRILVMNDGELIYDDNVREVFKHYKELEKVGLGAPEVTYIMHALNEAGLPVNTDAINVEEAKNSIMKVLRK